MGRTSWSKHPGSEGAVSDAPGFSTQGATRVQWATVSPPWCTTTTPLLRRALLPRAPTRLPVPSSECGGCPGSAAGLALGSCVAQDRAKWLHLLSQQCRQSDLERGRGRQQQLREVSEEFLQQQQHHDPQQQQQQQQQQWQQRSPEERGD